MQKQLLIAISSLALLTGYSCINNAVAEPAPTVAATSKASAGPVQSATPQPHPEETKSQAPDLATGEKVYKRTCSICHKTGLSSAPRMGSKDDWEARLAQGKEILYDRAINGYRGKKGSMPARGSNTKLSANDVKAAVDYMYEHAIPSWSMEK